MRVKVGDRTIEVPPARSPVTPKRSAGRPRVEPEEGERVQFAASHSTDMEMIQAAHAVQKSFAGEIDRLRAALQKIADESPPDTAYSWCQIKLRRCNAIALAALSD